MSQNIGFENTFTTFCSFSYTSPNSFQSQREVNRVTLKVWKYKGTSDIDYMVTAESHDSGNHLLSACKLHGDANGTATRFLSMISFQNLFTLPPWSSRDERVSFDVSYTSMIPGTWRFYDTLMTSDDTESQYDAEMLYNHILGLYTN